MDHCAVDGGELVEGPIPPVAPGEKLGGFLIKRAIAAGQTGVLLLGQREGEGEESERVIKVLNPAEQAIDARRAIFESVVAITMEGLHPLEEVLEHEGRLCLVRKVLTGTTLAQWLRQKEPLSPEEAVALGLRLCEVLKVVHESGLSHQDLRPGHLLIPEGALPREAVVLDLGSPSPAGRLSPPERYAGRPDPVKTDVYGLCVTLYVVLAGRSPYRADAVEELSWLVHNAPPPPLRVVRPEGAVDPLLERLILWGMAKEPGDRPSLERVEEVLKAIAADDREAVEGALEGATTPSRPAPVAETSPEPTTMTQRRQRLRSFKPQQLDDDNPTMRFVHKILPRSVLKATGLTQSFFVDGEEMEREVVFAELEEAVARRENVAAWFRLITLLLIAVVLGGVTVWALTR